MKVPSNVKVYLPGKKKRSVSGSEITVDKKTEDKINQAQDNFKEKHSKGVAGKEKSTEWLNNKINVRRQARIKLDAELKNRNSKKTTEKTVEKTDSPKPSNPGK